MDYINTCKVEFDGAKKAQDQEGGAKLIALASELSKIDDTFVNLVKKGKITF